MVSVLTFNRELSTGEKVRLIRMSKGWRQLDVAAVVRCSIADVSNLERNYYVSPGVKGRILAALEIDDE